MSGLKWNISTGWLLSVPAIDMKTNKPASALAPSSPSDTAAGKSACGLPSHVVIDLAKTPVKHSEAEWQSRLTARQYQVARQQGTEPSFQNEYWDHHGDGVYFSVCSDTPLFDSRDKFESGTGWPSFFDPIDRQHVAFVRDSSYGMVRVEIRCARCEGHLGHVFDDGPPPTGERYCMNSVSMRFVAEGDPLPDALGRGAPEGETVA
jgi:methionine-R-sulfoxide reductase